ncbi:Lar family restriction alleviation protein [Anaerotruncus massiliensis (ex Togo et al. 2019)]|uniref:Lar family restriction alleviation protein n=1 Tax=Anaerotruncus massiliensis (ex Togo et al. 2019) TaxID=1673720 RepID=UPI0027B895C3|nr:Lar family restriction alleviation protein [Anaerotruncus massiliensis (ex Togo et al. 2019)]
MSELLPCPFCGSNRVNFIPDEEQQIESTTTGFIWCHGCDFSSDSFYSEEIAIEKWNRRDSHE